MCSCSCCATSAPALPSLRSNHKLQLLLNRLLAIAIAHCHSISGTLLLSPRSNLVVVRTVREIFHSGHGTRTKLLSQSPRVARSSSLSFARSWVKWSEVKLGLLWIESFECVVLRSVSSGQGNNQARVSLSIRPWAGEVKTSLLSAFKIKLGGGGGGAMEAETSPLPRPLPREVTTQPSLSVSRIVWGKCRYPGNYGSGLCFLFVICYQRICRIFKCCRNGIGPWNLIWGLVRYHLIYLFITKEIPGRAWPPSIRSSTLVIHCETCNIFFQWVF